jgi:3-(3-hydroxy-phenyl)propionate hydroxylase
VLSTYTCPKFTFVPSAEQRVGTPVRHPVVVVGAGPIGLTAALDLASRGVEMVLLDDSGTVSVGSRAMCYAKRPLEIWDRLGCAAPMLAKGVSWKVGKVFFKDRLSYQSTCCPSTATRCRR